MITLPGVDLSSFQGPPGQWKAAAGGIAWAAVKWTELSPTGLYVNPAAAADWAALKAMGAGRVAYLFGHPATSPALTVTAFLGAVRAHGLADGDGIALDLEVSDGRTPAGVTAWATDVLEGLEREAGRRPYCYTFPSFAQAGNCAGLDRWPLWIADPSSPAGKPTVPAPWKTWAIHQYSASPIDRDVARYDSLAAMKAAMGKPRPASTPEEPMLLPAGQGAIYPVAFRNGDTKIRFYPGDTSGAELRVAFNGHTVIEVMLHDGAGAVDIPAGVLGCRVTRADAGTSPVSVVTF